MTASFLRTLVSDANQSASVLRILFNHSAEPLFLGFAVFVRFLGNCMGCSDETKKLFQIRK